MTEYIKEKQVLNTMNETLETVYDILASSNLSIANCLNVLCRIIAEMTAKNPQPIEDLELVFKIINEYFETEINENTD